MGTDSKEKKFNGKNVFNIFTGTLTRKLGSGFGAILIILIGLVVYTESKLSEVAELSERVSNLRLPTLDASKSMLSGVNRSLAGLRGYMLLGKDIFKAERTAAWEEDMLPALAFLTNISKKWTNPDNIAKLEQIKTELTEFQKAQEDIESISQTIDNNLSLKILLEEAAPEAAVMSRKITEMIDEELTLPATPERKALFGMMADVRGTLGLGLANIRAFILTGDTQFQDKFNTLWAKNSRRFQNLTDYAPLLSKTQKANFEQFSSSRKVFSPLPGQMFEMRGREDWNIANYWLGVKAAPRAKIITENLRSMVANQKVLAENDAKEASALLSALIKAISVLAVLDLALGAGLAYFTAKSITKPIQSAVEFSKSIADGDLSVADLAVTSQDEIGTLVTALNVMKKKLVDLITQFRGNAEQVASAATEIASAAEQSASGAGEQESQAGEVSSSIEQMAATIVESSQNATSATESARNAAEAAGEGGHIVQQTIEGMQAISESVKSSAATIAELGKRSDEIGEIIGVIDDIADQTNLLALNAAIEAARAGEQGRGFAVVADEVRKLAERTTKATAEIAGMIKGIQKDTSGAVTSMEEGTKQVESGMELAIKAGDSLTSIVSVVSEVQKMIEQIATASDEQSAAAEQISGNVGNIATVSKQSAQSAEQMAATAEELNRQTDALNELVSRFKLEDTPSSFDHDKVTEPKEG